MSKTASRPRLQFEPDKRYTTAEVAEALNTTVRTVRQWVYDNRFPDGGVIELPRGLRFYGWAVNELIAAWTR